MKKKEDFIEITKNEKEKYANHFSKDELTNDNLRLKNIIWNAQ